MFMRSASLTREQIKGISAVVVACVVIGFPPVLTWAVLPGLLTTIVGHFDLRCQAIKHEKTGHLPGFYFTSNGARAQQSRRTLAALRSNPRIQNPACSIFQQTSNPFPLQATCYL